MSFDKKVGALLYNAASGGRIRLSTAVKLYAVMNRYFVKRKAPSGRYTSNKIVEHVGIAVHPDTRTAWTSVAFPAEILYPFNIWPLTLEVISGLFSTLDLARGFLDRADAAGIPNTMCSFHRTLMGLSETDVLGKPIFVGAASFLCDGNLKSFSAAAENHGVPFLFLDVPYDTSDAAIDYVRDQLKGIIKLLEELCGKRLDEDSLRSTVQDVNRAFELGRRFHRARAGDRKNLYRGHELVNFAFPMHFMLGSSKLVDILTRRCNDVESGSGWNREYRSRYISDTARRIMWLHIVPQYNNNLWDIIDNGETAKIVCDEYSSPYYEDYDPADLLGSIAKRLISHPSNGPLPRRIAHILKIAKEYNVDGIIHYSSWGCHQAAGNVQLLEREITAAGYKFLSLNGDPIDQKNTSPEQHRTRLEAFLEGV